MAKPGDIGPLLDRLGRSATPQVPESSTGITLGQLAGTGLGPGELGATLVVGSLALLDSLGGLPIGVGTPGRLRDQADDAGYVRLIIDQRAFAEGPWVGSDAGMAHHLSEEIFEAGRRMRASGRSVWFLPDPTLPEGIDLARIKSTSTVVFGEVPEIDLEEEAPQTPEWTAVAALHDARRAVTDGA